MSILGRVSLSAFFAIASMSVAHADLINGGFEDYGVGLGDVGFFADAGNGGMSGWNTTAADHVIQQQTT